MEDTITNNATVSSIHSQEEHSKNSSHSVVGALRILKVVVLVPAYILLMTGLKIVDKKDRLRKKKRSNYYF